MTPDPVIAAEELSKSFGALCAVNALSLTVRRGETVGLLGPNGAGKTTAMRIFAGLSPADSGHIRVAGLDPARAGRAIRQRLGVVTQQDGLDTEISVRQNLELYGYLIGLSGRRARQRADEVLAFFALSERADDEVDELSGGMKRRLAIARALMGDPQLIILDEPSTGLDPHSREQVWEKLAELKSRGVTVLMSTHYMDEATVLCDRVAIMDRGRILALGPPHDLIAEHAGDEVLEIRAPEVARAALRRVLDEAGASWREIGAVFRLARGAAVPPGLTAMQGVRIHRRPANLEDVFLGLTGKELVDG